MRQLARRAVAVTAATILGLGVVAPAAAHASPTAVAQLPSLTTIGKAIGLSTDGRSLSKFSISLPALALPLGRISGLTGDSKLIGIDYRVQNNTVYGVGNKGGIYTFADAKTKATKVSQLTVALSGTDFGVDFNPAADRLRVVSDTGQNLRHDVNPAGVTIADTPLTIAGAPATGITAAAYSNNDLNATTATVLYDIDSTRDQLVEQTPANAGTLLVRGPLFNKPEPQAGFDILTTVDEGVAVQNTGYVTLRVPGARNSVLSTIDLATGKTRTVGQFLLANVADLAIIQPR